MTREVVVVSAVRTAIGTFGGSLKDIPPTELGAQVVRESLKRAHVDGKDVGHVVFGHVVNTEPKRRAPPRLNALEPSTLTILSFSVASVAPLASLASFSTP